MTARLRPASRSLGASDSSDNRQSEGAAAGPASIQRPDVVKLPVENSGRENYGTSAPRQFDVHGQSALLREAFSPQPKHSPETAPPLDSSSRRTKRWVEWRNSPWRLIKTAVALAIAIGIGWAPVQRLLERSSTEAVVNARLVTLRAPIDGKVVAFTVAPEVGTKAENGTTVLRIQNRRADRARLDDLRRTVGQLEGERPAMAARLARLQELRIDVVAQARAFQRGRVRELEIRVQETNSAIAAAVATRIEAVANAERASALAPSGTVTKAALDRAQRDGLVATETENALRHRLAAIEVELEAARRGMYVGDSYNDRPSSTQQADELAVRIAELAADLRAREERLHGLEEELKLEGVRYSELSEADLISPVVARVWEVLVSPGEEVRRGQDLVRLLDCSGVLVTTAVSESVYNHLQLGDPARFRFTGGETDYPGRVIRLSGLAAPPDNLAIQPAALNGAYRATVSIPAFVGASCAVGRTGRVVFQSADNAATETPPARPTGP